MFLSTYAPLFHYSTFACRSFARKTLYTTSFTTLNVGYARRKKLQALSANGEKRARREDFLRSKVIGLSQHVRRDKSDETMFRYVANMSRCPWKKKKKQKAEREREENIKTSAERNSRKTSFKKRTSRYRVRVLADNTNILFFFFLLFFFSSIFERTISFDSVVRSQRTLI